MSLRDALKNSKGQVFYGMHFYPGVARYEPPGEEPFTVFINENVIREMGPTFEGRPIFVEHVNDVDEDLDTLRGEADGWVVESFFNKSDGKNWVKFILTSEQGIQAAKEGWKLSNAYIPECLEEAGTWNGVPYDRKVVAGEFEHLAIVQNPRYEESVIMTPSQFKAYNEKETAKLLRLANSKDKKGETKMKLNIFKRQKIENAPDLDGMIVELPKSKKEVSLTKVIDEYDKIMNMNGYASDDHMVKVGNEEHSVKDLVKKHMEMQNEMAEMKKKKDGATDEMENETDGEPGMDENDPAVENEAIEGSDMGDVGDRGGDVHMNEDGDEESEGAEEAKKKDKTKNAKDKALKFENEKKRFAKEKALRLRNAHLREPDEEATIIDLSQDQIARGKSLYGSGN